MGVEYAPLLLLLLLRGQRGLGLMGVEHVLLLLQ